MSLRRPQSLPPEKPPRNKCISVICVSWKVFTCIFSHVTLVTSVVAYCILGAFTFEHLEKDNEKNVNFLKLWLTWTLIVFLNNLFIQKKVKNGIILIRDKVTKDVWNFTKNSVYLDHEIWTKQVIHRLQVWKITLSKQLPM